MLGICSCFCCRLLTFIKTYFSKNKSGFNTIIVWNGLNTDQSPHFLGSKLYAKVISRQSKSQLVRKELSTSLNVENYAMTFQSILRDFKNAPFYILCLFHMIYLRMFSLSYFILLQNGPWFAMVSIRSCCSFWRNIDVSVFQQLLSDKREFDSNWRQLL